MTDPPPNPEQLDGTCLVCPTLESAAAVLWAMTDGRVGIGELRSALSLLGSTASEYQAIADELLGSVDKAPEPKPPRKPPHYTPHPRYRRPGCRNILARRRTAQRQQARKKRRF